MQNERIRARPRPVTTCCPLPTSITTRMHQVRDLVAEESACQVSTHGNRTPTPLTKWAACYLTQHIWPPVIFLATAAPDRRISSRLGAGIGRVRGLGSEELSKARRRGRDGGGVGTLVVSAPMPISVTSVGTRQRCLLHGLLAEFKGKGSALSRDSETNTELSTRARRRGRRADSAVKLSARGRFRGGCRAATGQQGGVVTGGCGVFGVCACVRV